MTTQRELPPDTGLVEVADRVWVARHTAFDVNATVIAGGRGYVVVDSLWSEAAARGLHDQARALGVGDLVAVVNTHHHVDHTLGNAALSGVPVHAHEAAAEAFAAHTAQVQAACADDPEQIHRADIVASRPVAPTSVFSSVGFVDLGDRVVELVHPGRGHTAGDVVVRVEDADVLLAGDLVEESEARNGVPGYGTDCFPIAWPQTMDLVLTLLGADTLVVPGHGNPVGRGFVEDQRDAIGVVAETIRDLAGRGIGVDQALAGGEWPFPSSDLADAVRRGYAELPRQAKHLPLA